jgi:hypothetical protein
LKAKTFALFAKNLCVLCGLILKKLKRKDRKDNRKERKGFNLDFYDYSMR